MPFWYTTFQKKYPYHPSHTLPRSVASLPRFAPPLLKNPGYASGPRAFPSIHEVAVLPHLHAIGQIVVAPSNVTINR